MYLSGIFLHNMAMQFMEDSVQFSSDTNECESLHLLNYHVARRYIRAHNKVLSPQTPSLMSHGEGLMPSVLAFASEQNFIGQNMATNSDQLGR